MASREEFDLDAPPTQSVFVIAQVEARGVFSEAPDLGRSLRAAIDPGASISRYRKQWRMGQPLVDEEQHYVGRIGFERTVETTNWDASAVDFTQLSVREGLTSQFAIDLSNLRVAYQLRPPTIKKNTARGALEKLINESSEVIPWRIHDIFYDIGWSAWRDAVDRTTDISITTALPNPRFVDAPQLETLFDETAATMLKLAASSDTGLNVNDAQLFRQALDHAIERGYGSTRATGVTSAGQESKWSSEKAQMAIERSLPAGDNGEVTGELLAAELADETHGEFE